MTLLLPKKFITIVFFLLPAVNVFSQTPPLQGYIDTALANNLVLQQKNISSEKALYALKIANTLFLPTITGEGNYLSGAGGRQIDLPMGTLLNNMYTSLNQLTSSQKFPQVQDETVNFLPENFYDVKIHATIPVFNRDIMYAKKIAAGQAELQQYDVAVYQRELVKNVKCAYYNYQNALQMVGICRSSLALAVEGKRVNEKFLANGKGLAAYVLRSESEIAGIEANVVKFTKQADNARVYFNFLLNRRQDAAVTIENTSASLVPAIEFMSKEITTSQREEMKAVQGMMQIAGDQQKLANASVLPKVSGFTDLGLQSEHMNLNTRSGYYMVGIQLAMPLFTARRNVYKARQAALDVEDARLFRKNTVEQLQMAAEMAKNNLAAEWSNYQSSLRQVEAAASYYRLISRGYAAGTNSYIETVDARNQLTAAELSSQTAVFNVLTAAAVLERETASYPLKQ